MRNLLTATIAILCLALTSCQSSCCDGASPQAIVDATASANAGCTRLTLHCMQADGSAKVCASTDSARLGTASEAEDIRAMQSGEAVVMDEGSAIDVTVPIMQTDGKWTTVCGVTLERGEMSREAAVAKAKTIAMAVKASLGTSCPDGNCCSK